MIIVESVEILEGNPQRILETYGDLIIAPRFQYYENEPFKISIIYRDLEVL